MTHDDQQFASRMSTSAGMASEHASQARPTAAEAPDATLLRETRARMFRSLGLQQGVAGGFAAAAATLLNPRGAIAFGPVRTKFRHRPPLPTPFLPGPPPVVTIPARLAAAPAPGRGSPSRVVPVAHA